MTSTLTHTLSRAASAALLLGLATLAAPNAAAQRNDPVSGTWMISVDGAAHAPASIWKQLGILMAPTTLPQNACTSGPVEIGAGHGQWRFRPQNRRLRWRTVSRLTGQEVLPGVIGRITADGAVQKGPNGPVFNGNARFEVFLDANALQQGSPSCTTQVPVSGFELSDAGDML